MLTKWVETEWEWEHGFTAAILFGRKDRRRLALSAGWQSDSFSVGVGVWPIFGHVSLSLGFLTLFVTLRRPYPRVEDDGTIIVATEPETPEAEAEREEDERCCFLMEDIAFAVADKPSGELERILALVKESADA